ncbi:LacI family DNA-binding transcriptional regulator [Alkalicoccus urumqiensis]|uniref:Transcriptional regulator n=1 Tax=Alkalicoccus urumqiensis TaxID=1548213 RepID=A0A2P6MLZ9_ALKUR|nr:LacI family DNA-binding transcriptional regulator [Alkalicoccus urumqiensis]PRO67295.1 transcriptional regulator [Alkalicoccus urumqiensis]
MFTLATIREVAEAANVSIATVSRILNDDQSIVVLDETRQRVVEVARKMEYQPMKRRSKKAYVKKTVRAWKIGILTWNNTEDDQEDPYFREIIEGIQAKAEELEMHVEVTLRLRRLQGEGALEQLDGIIVIGKSTAEDIEALYPHPNIVFVDQSPDKSRFDSVLADLDQASENVLQHLMQLGHKKVGFLGGREMTQYLHQRNKEAVDPRLTYFIRFMKERNLYEEALVFLGDDTIGDWSSHAGYHMMKQALAQGELPSAFFAASDPIALGAIRALNEAGYSVPHDTAIVSVDDVEFAKYVTPPLTTTKLYGGQMGRTACSLLLERMEGRDVPLQVIVPTTMIVRESCGAKAAHSD